MRGRLVASVIGLLLCLGYVALTVWTGGEAVVAVADRVFGVAESDPQYALGYVVVALLIAAAAVYGFGWLVRINKLIVPVVLVTMVLMVVAFAGAFDASYAGTPDAYAVGDFWPTWLLAMLSAGIAGPVSYVTLTGDWTRYVSPARHTPRRVVGYTFLGLLVGLIVPELFGAFIGVAAFNADSFVLGPVQAGPAWLLLPILLTAVIGSLGQGGLNLYSMGLDLDAILPRLTRTQATLAVAVGATLLVFLGRFVWSAESAVTTFVVFLTSLATPWAVVTMMGYVRLRGRYDEPSLQVFNRRERGGAYWFTAGWNFDAVAAWALGSLVGVLSNATDTYQGPVAGWFGGVDVSVVTSAIVAGATYALLIRLRPHAHAATALPDLD